MTPRYPKDLLSLIQQVTSRRPRLVLDHILRHGSVTTEELRQLYGYDHPPRAARDVRERGIPLKTETVLGSSGRRLARYTIDVREFKRRRSRKGRGRQAAPAQLKRQLVEERRARCELCLSVFENERPLQVDHRVPYEIGGDPLLSEPQHFMLVCAPCNRRKSWQCEHCANWTRRDLKTCQSCFWASPSNYSHVATTPSSVVMISFAGSDLELFEQMKKEAEASGLPIEETIKRRLRDPYTKNL